MTPAPAPLFLERVKAALADGPQTPAGELAAVSRAVGVSPAAAFHLIALVRGQEAVPVPPRTVDR